MKKEAQMNLSFGMIFSVILIIFFLAFAFYGIKKLIDIQKETNILKFKTEIESDIDKMWKSTKGTYTPKNPYKLPSEIEYVCFADFESEKIGSNENLYNKLERYYHGKENMFFYPVTSFGKSMVSTEIEHINIEKITEEENPFCIENKKGIKITLIKDFGENLVKIER